MMRSSTVIGAPWVPLGGRCRLAGMISLVVLLAAACGANTGTPDTKDRPSGNPTSSLTLPSAGQYPSTVEELVAYLAKSGLAVPNPRDVTQRDCPAVGCTRKVQTDTVAIMAFSTTGKAQLYAASATDVFQVANVVMSFSVSVPTDQRPAFEAAVQRAIE